VRSRWWFLFLVAFFTLFGAGKSHCWSALTTDRSGWSYAVDLYSISVHSGGVVCCRVLATHDAGGRVVDAWRLDARNNRLTRRSLGRSETILPGSVAEQALLFFRQRGDLPALDGLARKASR
jgi:hypothetical protein